MLRANSQELFLFSKSVHLLLFLTKRKIVYFTICSPLCQEKSFLNRIEISGIHRVEQAFMASNRREKSFPCAAGPGWRSARSVAERAKRWRSLAERPEKTSKAGARFQVVPEPDCLPIHESGC